MSFPGGSEVKASASNAGNPDLIPGLGRSPGEGNGNPLQYSCLKNPMDGGAWQATVHGVAKSRTRLSDFTFKFQTYISSFLLDIYFFFRYLSIFILLIFNYASNIQVIHHFQQCFQIISFSLCFQCHHLLYLIFFRIILLLFS